MTKRSDGGRLLSVGIADVALTELHYLNLERRLNDVIEAGTGEMARLRAERKAAFLAEWGTDE